MSLKVLISGSTYFNDYWYVEGFLHSVVSSDPLLILDGAHGPGEIAIVAAQRLKMKYVEMPADWGVQQYGPQAHRIKYQVALDHFQPTFVVVFTYNIFECEFSRSLARLAISRKLKVMLNPSTMANRPQVVRAQGEMLYVGLGG